MGLQRTVRTSVVLALTFVVDIVSNTTWGGIYTFRSGSGSRGLASETVV